MLTGVTFDHKPLVIVRRRQYWCTRERLLQLFKRCLLVRAPFESYLPAKPREWGAQVAEVLDKSPIVLCQPPELHDLSLVLGCRPLPNSPNLLWVSVNPLAGDDMTQKFHTGSSPFTLRGLGPQLMLSQTLQHLFYMPYMVLHATLAVDKDIIQVAHHTGVQYISQHIVDDPTERIGRPTQPEGHYRELVHTVAGRERCLVLVRLSNPHLVVRTIQVDLREVFGPMQPVQQLVTAGQQRSVLDGDVIQSPVINTHPLTPILLLDEDDRCRVWRGRGLDETRFQQLTQLSLQLLQVRRTHLVGHFCRWGCIR